ncbi:MAG: SAM-dependent methyltransferase [Oscillospiraceae bacterium]|nr:SAM-dependent methyltransferase [Oscillospiraceae bacterium]
MKDECLICGAPLEYLENDVMMECAVCHKKENSKTACVNGHYVCNDCHTQGLDSIIAVCLRERSKNPIEIIQKMMALPFCHMHGPEHHVMVGAALLTAYKNAGGDIDLEKALSEMQARGRQVPGGACGFWGACGAGISAGIFVSIATGATPLAKNDWGLSNKMTSAALGAIGEVGGPRCCKRDSYLSIMEAVAFAREHLGVAMEMGEIRCVHSHQNNQCIGKRCPFFQKNSD